MNKSFKIYTRAIILNKKNEVLMLQKTPKQKYWAWKWMLPWGTVEFWENIEKTLQREVKEEVNLSLNSLKIIDTRTMLIENEHRLWIYYIATCNNIKKLNNNEPSKHKFCGFVDINTIWNFIHKELILNYIA